MLGSNRVRFAGGMLAVGIVGAAMYIGSAGQGYTPGVSMPVGCNGGESPQWDGTQWQCRQTTGDYRALHYDCASEMIGNNACNLGGAQSGTGAVTNEDFNDGSVRPGIFDLSTGTTTTGVARVNTSGGGWTVGDFPSQSVTFVGGIPTLSTAADEFSVVIGFWDVTTSPDQVDGCYLLYNRSNLASGNKNPSNLDKWECWCSTASTRTGYLMDGSTVSDGSFTTHDSPVAAAALPNTNWFNLEVRESTGLVQFFVNGVDSCHITQNIPSGTNTCAAGAEIIKSAGLNSRSLWIDWFRQWFNMLSVRVP